MASVLLVDKLDPQSGTALEIGTSGDTITVPSGATLDISASTLTPPATMPASSGINFTALNASNLGSGTVPTARLGTGSASSSVFLAGDSTWIAAGGDNTPYFAASIGTSYTTTHEVYHKMEYDTEIYDSDSAYDTTLFRFTVPAGEGGYYQFGYSNRCASGYPGTMGVYQTEIYKNGSSMDLGGGGEQGGFYWNAYSAQRSIMATSTFIVSLAAADYIELFGWQGSLDSGNETVIGEWSYFWGMKLLT